MPHQFNQWTTVLEPFVSRVVHSTYVPQYYEDADGASVYSGHVSLVPTCEDDKFSNRRRNSVARPWSLIGRKGVHSASSSVTNFDVSDKVSILSPNMLPTLFLNGDLPRSPLHLSFVPENDVSPMQLLTESPVGCVPPPLVPGNVPDLTHRVRKDGHFPAAHGGYSDVWKAVWKRDDVSDVKVAVKVVRNTASDPATEDKLVKVCCTSNPISDISKE